MTGAAARRSAQAMTTYWLAWLAPTGRGGGQNNAKRRKLYRSQAERSGCRRGRASGPAVGAAPKTDAGSSGAVGLWHTFSARRLVRLRRNRF